MRKPVIIRRLDVGRIARIPVVVRLVNSILMTGPGQGMGDSPSWTPSCAQTTTMRMHHES